MAVNRTSQLHEATIRSNWLLQKLGRELRLARIAAGTSQADIARRIGTSKAQVSRIEHGKVRRLSLVAVALHAGAVGRFSAQLYPGVRRVLDAPQLSLLNRLQNESGAFGLGSSRSRCRRSATFAPLTQRMSHGALTVAVEAITRLADVQAQVRAAQLKRRDIGATRLLLLVGDSNANRRALAEVTPMLSAGSLLGTRHILGFLAAGEDPGRDCLVVL